MSDLFTDEAIDRGIPTQQTPTNDVSLFTSEPLNKQAQISVISQQVLNNIPPSSSNMIVDSFAKTTPSFSKKWNEGLDYADLQRQIDALSFRQALKDPDPSVAAKIKALQAKQASLTPPNMVQSFVSGAGEQGAANIRAGGMWLLGALSWPYRKLAEVTGLSGLHDAQEKMLSDVGQTFGLSKDRVDAMSKNPVTGLLESAKESTAGIVGPNYRMLVDQGVNSDVASGVSFAIGGVLNALQFVPAGRLIPGVERLGQESFKAAVVQMARDGSLLGLAKMYSSRVGVVGAEQATIAAVNAATNVLGNEWARQYSNMTKGTNIPATSFGELVKDILVQAAPQAVVGTALGAVTAGREVQTAYKLGTRAQQFMDDLRFARARPVTEPAPTEAKALPSPRDIQAPIDDARSLVTSDTPFTPEATKTVRDSLSSNIDALVKEPTPQNIPQILDHAQAIDALDSLSAKPPAIEGEWKPEGLSVEASPKILENAVKQGVPVEDSVLQSHITQPWARNEMQARIDTRDYAIVSQEQGIATDSQEFAALMKSSEMAGQDRPLSWYEKQWDAMDSRRAPMDKARSEEFVNSLTRTDLENTLKSISDNPGAPVNKTLEPWIAKSKSGLSDKDFQAFVAEVAKSPARYRNMITAGLDEEGRQNQLDSLAESVAHRVTREVATDEQLRGLSDKTIGELTTSTDPEHQKAAQQISKVMQAAMKKPSSAIDYSSQVAIRDLQDSITLDSGPKLREVRDRLKTYYEKHPSTPPDAATQAILNRKLLSDMSVKDVLSLADQIDAERMKGKAVRQIAIVKERKFVEDFKNRLMDDIQMGKGWKKNEVMESFIPPKGMENFEPVKGFGSKEAQKALRSNPAQKVAANFFSPYRVFRFLGPRGEQAWDMMNASRDAAWRGNDAILEPAIRKFKDLGITAHELARQLSTKDGLHFPVDEVIGMVWAHGDENSRETMLYGNNITEDQYKELASQLNPKEKEWGEYMQSVFGLDNWRRLEKAHIQETNTAPGPGVEKYFPIRHTDTIYSSPADEIAQDRLARSGIKALSPTKRFMVARENINPEHRKRMKLGATALFFEQVSKQEHYINVWETSKRLRKIFLQDQRVKDQIALKYGNDWNQAIESAITAFSNPSALRASNPGDKIMDFGRHILTNAGLLGNLVSVGYNLTGPLQYLGDAGPRYLLQGLAEYMMNPKKVWEEVTTNVPQIKHASIDPVLNALKTKAPNDFRNFMQTVEKIGYQPIELVDMATRLVGAKAVQLKGINQGMSPKDAWNMALLATQRSQPSGDPSDLPMAYHAHGMKMFLAFTRQINQLFNMWAGDMPNEAVKGHIAQFIGDAVGIALAGLFINMMRTKDIPKDPKEAALWMLDQFVVGIPIIGNQIEPLLVGNGYMGRTGAEVIPEMQKTITDVSNVFKPHQPPSKRLDAGIKSLIDLTRFVGGPAVFLTRMYGVFHTGDPWELFGGPPRRR